MSTVSSMRRLLVTAVLCLATVVPTAGATTTADADRAFSTSPSTKDGKRWRIAYYEGGPNGTYYLNLHATIAGLMQLGWMTEQPLPDVRERDTRSLWKWLVNNARSDFLEFADDGYYSADWNEEVRDRTREELLTRLNRQADFDLVIAMGTWAGKDLASPRHRTPTVVMSTSDPIGSGIIKSAEDSGLAHVHARVDPHRYERQVRVFHDIIHFKRLGVAYENSTVGRTYAAIETVEKVAAERGFEVVRCFTQSDTADRVLAAQSVVDCFKFLATNADAIYVTVQGGVNGETIPELVRIANEHRVPTFSQLGSEEVRNGFLLSISRAGGFRPVGLFLAATMAKVFNGAQPHELKQIFEDTPNIAINLKTAEMVGFYLYADVLAAADEIYRDISLPGE